MAEKKMWGGRFSQETDADVEAYTQSVGYDKALYEHDISGSRAHARMLAKQGVISQEDAARIDEGLEQVLKEIRDGAFVWRVDREDVHMNIEARLTELVGDAGRRLHTGRSRNDQVALDFRLWVGERNRAWQGFLRTLIAVLVERAEEHKETLLPGCTHFQPAQPVSLAHHLLAYAWMFRRDASRLEDACKRVMVSPLGAAALAGTTYPLDPAFTAAALGMDGVFENSMDAVSDRDFALEALFCASTIMMHLSRLCEEIIIWANPAFGFVALPDGYATGSSIMPQKKNPDVAELMRGKTGRVYGALVSLLTVMKGLPMTYNRDLQEDKEPFLDADRTVSASLRLMAGMLHKLVFRKDRMATALRRGFLNATELADYLVGKGIAFREAHHLTGHAVALAESRGVNLEDLSLEELRNICPKITEDVYAVLEPEAAVRRRQTHGGTGPGPVEKQLVELKSWLASRISSN